MLVLPETSVIKKKTTHLYFSCYCSLAKLTQKTTERELKLAAPRESQVQTGTVAGAFTWVSLPEMDEMKL